MTLRNDSGLSVSQELEENTTVTAVLCDQYAIRPAGNNLPYFSRLSRPGSCEQ